MPFDHRDQAPPPNANRERREALRHSILDGILGALMLGAGESYFGALAVELGHRDVALSILGTLPLLVGALFQLVSPRLVRLFGGEKPVVVGGALLQAFSHAGLIWIAVTGSTSLAALVAIKTLYWTSGAGIAPAWNAWMARLVPRKLRASYFARRNLLTHAGLLVSFVVAGALVELGAENLGSALPAFAGLYAFALAARVGSALILARQSRFLHHRTPVRIVKLREVIRRGRWRVAAFMATILFGSQIAIPFFTPYMLEEMGLDMFGFALLSSVSIFAKGASFPFWKRARRRIRPVPILAGAGLMIAITPTLWAMGANIPLLVFAQIVAGVAWAGYDLTALELLFGDAPENGSVEFFALANSLAGITQLSGALLGGWALRAGIAYEVVFLVSGGARLVALLLLMPLLAVRDQLRRVRLVVRFIGSRPSAGAVLSPAMRVPRSTIAETAPEAQQRSGMDSQPLGVQSSRPPIRT